MIRVIIAGCLAAGGLLALGGSVGVAIHRRSCEETLVGQQRRLLKQDALLVIYESDLADRDRRIAHLEQVNGELKGRIDDAFEFGRLVEHEYGGGS